MTLLITGCAGFIGFHLATLRLARGETVIGLDNLNPYYDVALKKARLARLQTYPNFTFYEADICDAVALTKLFDTHQPTHVVNLAAQAGVRYSLENPMSYVQSNVVGFTALIEACRHHQVAHLVYASTSSVYGANLSQPYSEQDGTNHPLTIYAASKKANELIAHSYAHLFNLPSTGLRFFTVYGPWGRPDMALFSFTRDILAGIPIKVFNQGHMERDFTYIDDIIRGLDKVIDVPAVSDANWDGKQPDPASSNAPYRVYNIGSGRPVSLLDYIAAIENATGEKAIKTFCPLQAGDVISTYSDTKALEQAFDEVPTMPIQDGVNQFVQWYREYYG